QPMTVRIRLRATRDVARATVGVQIARDWHVLHGTRSNRQGIDIAARAGEPVVLEVEYRQLGLSGGTYAVHVAVLEQRLAEARARRAPRATPRPGAAARLRRRPARVAFHPIPASRRSRARPPGPAGGATEGGWPNGQGWG